MIKSIGLENWKTHKKTFFEFSEGTNVIVGKMGSGKSSVMDAVSFALYGTFPALAQRKVSIDETIMLKPLKQETAKVELEFDYGGKTYSVQRVLKRKGTNEAYVRLDGKIIAGPKTTDATKKISEILEVPYELFSRAIYSEQNQVDFFLKLSPAQRKEKFDELLGLDRYETVRTNSVTLANRLRAITEDRKKLLKETGEKAGEKELAEYEKRISEKEKELAEKTSALAKAAEEEKKRALELRGLEEAEKERQFLRELEIKARSRLEAIREQIKEAKEKAGGKSGKEIREFLAKAGGKEKEAETLIEKNRAKEEETLKAISNAREELAVLRSQTAELGKKLSETEKLEAQCPVCKKPLSEHDKEKLKGEIEAAEKKLKEKTGALEKKEKEESGTLAQTRKTGEELEKGLKALQKEKESLEKNLEMLSENAEKEKQEKNLCEELEKLSKQTGKTGPDEKELGEKRKAHSETREKIAGLESGVKSGKETLKELEAGAKMVRENIAKARELGEKIGAGEKTLEKLAIFTSALRSTQAELRNTMVETVNQAMDELWPKIYPYADIETVKILVDEGSYEVMARQRNGEWQRVEGILSGGERSSVALTLRIAVSLVLTRNLGWIILDEPTHNLDAKAVRELSETMRNRLPELIAQIFLITHDKEMENAASGKLYALEREKEKDGATLISGAGL